VEEPVGRVVEGIAERGPGRLEQRLPQRRGHRLPAEALRGGRGRRLGLAPEGVVRIGLTHYNTREEVDRLIEALAGIAGSAAAAA
jgi:selenocysteine lyase/cysteine desulfurase